MTKVMSKYNLKDLGSPDTRALHRLIEAAQDITILAQEKINETRLNPKRDYFLHDGLKYPIDFLSNSSLVLRIFRYWAEEFESWWDKYGENLDYPEEIEKFTESKLAEMFDNNGNKEE